MPPDRNKRYDRITGDEQGIIKFYMDKQLYKEVRFNRRFDKETYIRDFKKTTRRLAYRIKFTYEIIIE